MSFGAAIQTVFRKYAEFTGLAARPEFWWWILFTALVSSALGLFNVIPVGDATLGYILVGLWNTAVLVPTLAVLVRRLRDAGYGWGHAFWLLVPIAGLIILAVFCSQPSKEPGGPLK
ncbi:DUF805 domain-containing protein [Microbacterium pumilum]|uniref:DUF805 domain-containing protein n=1 Tax=Microbacterium pumilum TaxID=344165 RepID=A0ABP5DZU9_9MICO